MIRHFRFPCIRIDRGYQKNIDNYDFIVYAIKDEKERLYLLFAYPKNVQENLTADQKKSIAKMIELIKKG